MELAKKFSLVFNISAVAKKRARQRKHNFIKQNFPSYMSNKQFFIEANGKNLCLLFHNCIEFTWITIKPEL